MRHLFLLFVLTTLNFNIGFAQESNQNNKQDFFVSISRTEGQDIISLKEWLDYTKLDYKLKASTNKNSNLENNSLTFFMHEDGKKVPFQFNNGTISTQNPSKEVIFKMFLISKRLNAVVKNSSGKVYSNNDFYKQ